jgi:hypothetical protein
MCQLHAEIMSLPEHVSTAMFSVCQVLTKFKISNVWDVFGLRTVVVPSSVRLLLLLLLYHDHYLVRDDTDIFNKQIRSRKQILSLTFHLSYDFNDVICD